MRLFRSRSRSNSVVSRDGRRESEEDCIMNGGSTASRTPSLDWSQNSHERQRLGRGTSRRSLRRTKSLRIETTASVNSQSPDSFKTSETASTFMSTPSRQSPEPETLLTPPGATSAVEASSLLWDPPFPSPSDNNVSTTRRDSIKSSRKGRSKSALRLRADSTTLRRYGSDGEDSLKRSTRPTRFHDCLVTLDYAPKHPLQIGVMLDKNFDKVDQSHDDPINPEAPKYVSAERCSRSHKCICGGGDECTGVSAAFHILNDPRGAYTKLPKLQKKTDSQKNDHFDFSMNRLRSLLLGNLVPPDQIHSFHDEFRGKRKYIANHHFHPKLVSWAADKSGCNIPMCISEEEMNELQLGFTQESMVLNKEGKATNKYFVLANYNRESTKKDLKQTLSASVVHLRSRDRKLIKRMSSRNMTQLSRDDKRMIRKMSSKKLLSISDDNPNEKRTRSTKTLERAGKTLDSTSVKESPEEPMEVSSEVSQNKLETEPSGEESAQESSTSRPASQEHPGREDCTSSLNELPKNTTESLKELKQPSFKITKQTDNEGRQSPAPRPSLVLEESFRKTLGCTMDDLMKDNSNRSQESSASNFIPSVPSGEGTQENVTVTSPTKLPNEIGVSLPPKPAFLDLDQNEKDVMYSKLSAFESRRRSAFSVKMMSTSLQWRSSLEKLEDGLSQTATAEHWVQEASNATHHVVHDVIMESESVGQSKVEDSAVKGGSSSPIPVFSGYVSSCIADELTRTKPQLEDGVSNLEKMGRAVIGELESAEVRVIEAWDAYDAAAQSCTTANENEEASEKSEKCSTDLWAVQMRYRVAVANQSLAWKMASGKLSSLFDSVEKAEGERRAWLRKLLVEVLTRTPVNSTSEVLISKLKGIVQDIESYDSSSSQTIEATG